MKTCYVIGGGASLKEFDWEMLRGADVIGVNDSILLNIPVKYGVFHDSDWGKVHQDALVDAIRRGTDVSTTGSTRLHPSISNKANTGRFNTLNFRDMSTLPFYRCSGDAGIALAAMLGYKEICLLGFDCHWTEGESHWHVPMRRQRENTYKSFMQEAGRLDEDLKTFFPGVKVINMHPEGQQPSSIPCWPKEAFQNAIINGEAVASGPKILVASGIGDFYWVATYLEDFAKQNNIPLPLNIYVYNPESSKYDRLHEFVDQFPFCIFRGYERHMPAATWNAGYMKEAPLHRNVPGSNGVVYDYFLCPNGVTRLGGTLEEAAAPYKVDWGVYKQAMPPPEHPAKVKGKFFLCYFARRGMFLTSWWNRMGTDKIMKLVDTLVKETGYTAVLLGAHFDAEKLPFEGRGPNYLDLRGDTSMMDVMALARDCEFCVGWCSGVTLLPQVMEKPTHIIWSDYFDKRFWKSFGRDTPAYHTYDVRNTVEAMVSKILGKRSEVLKEEVQLTREMAQDTHNTTVVWVYKTGGVYDGRAEKLIRDQHEAIQCCTPVKLGFVCLTDSGIPLPDGVRREKLEHNLPGWFSKFELFRTGYAPRAIKCCSSTWTLR